jgi:hypothetical protein
MGVIPILIGFSWLDELISSFILLFSRACVARFVLKIKVEYDTTTITG